jgi:hypothetical protein
MSHLFLFNLFDYLKQDEDTGDQTNYVEKHVEFNDDVNDDADNPKDLQQQQKLHRRDTPHHLKNKRIISKNEPITLDVNI